jgi:hypothetical protein
MALRAAGGARTHHGAPDLRSRARAALSARLRELAPPGALHADGGHTVRFADALAADARACRRRLGPRRARGAGEGRAAPDGGRAIPAHAAWSSTALVCAAFAPWARAARALRVAGTGPFEAVRLEERLLIPHGGGTPNLDVALPRGGGLTGVESKLTEHLAPRAPRPWRPAYRRPAMAAALDGGWAEVFGDLLEGRWAPRHLDAGQLVRHALSLRGAGDLVLVFWEPTDADDTPRCAPTARRSRGCSSGSRARGPACTR